MWVEHENTLFNLETVTSIRLDGHIVHMDDRQYFFHSLTNKAQQFFCAIKSGARCGAKYVVIRECNEGKDFEWELLSSGDARERAQE